jgi:hypothetical protein
MGMKGDREREKRETGKERERKGILVYLPILIRTPGSQIRTLVL